jgi:hypothetical protein
LANKYNWFAHRNDAHEDLFIQEAIERFGHFGYAAYFMLLEIFDRHGVGDTLEIPLRVLAQKMRTKRKSAGNVLGMFQESGKINYSTSGNNLIITIPNFRKFQANRKSKITSKPLQNHLKTTIHNNNKDKDICERDFELFWTAYPRKEAKPAARRAWEKLAPSGAVVEKIMASIPAWEKTEQWSERRFIPHPATFLNQKRFNDEIKTLDSTGLWEKMEAAQNGK